MARNVSLEEMATITGALRTHAALERRDAKSARDHVKRVEEIGLPIDTAKSLAIAAQCDARACQMEMLADELLHGRVLADTNQAFYEPRCLGPHGVLEAIDPPRESPPRRWRCNACGAEGLLAELRALACTHSRPVTVDELVEAIDGRSSASAGSSDGGANG